MLSSLSSQTAEFLPSRFPFQISEKLCRMIVKDLWFSIILFFFLNIARNKIKIFYVVIPSYLFVFIEFIVFIVDVYYNLIRKNLF